jgi:hypothetical protein
VILIDASSQTTIDLTTKTAVGEAICRRISDFLGQNG